MSLLQRVLTAQKALRELGLGQTCLYAWYRIGLHSGYLRWKTRTPGQKVQEPSKLNTKILHPLPDPDLLQGLLGREGVQSLIAEADEVVSGRVRLFGGEAVPLVLEPPNPLLHWTDYELGKPTARLPDLKLIWEPARFGWACTLARAYYLSQDERYPEAFWRYAELFLDSNPPFLGPHWISAQEAALRLMAFVFTIQILAASRHSTAERQSRLAEAIAFHAQRIPPTMVYGRAQNNNHLLTEAVGLFTAGVVLDGHPSSERWRETGWRWLNLALQTQIAPDGAYVQNSSNYHRLMLQSALWTARLAESQGRHLPEATLQRLAAATLWIGRLLDPDSGCVPNLGPNDGAYILPLTTCQFQDYRPVLHAASIAFTGAHRLKAGPWSELSLWTCPEASRNQAEGNQAETRKFPAGQSPYRIENPASSSWAYFRVAHFTSRPGHADQLHVDLWWRGLNIARDAGTYLYNASPPWDNSLAHTAIHNTLTVNDQDQMTLAGRFLWLDWAQARLLEHEEADDGSWVRLSAQHDGYRRLGIAHQRSVTARRDGCWTVEDGIVFAKQAPVASPLIKVRLHWLLPDWPWEVEQDGTGAEIYLTSPHGPVTLRLDYEKTDPLRWEASILLVRAGELVYGAGQPMPVWGWESDTYAHKIPALSFSLKIRDHLPIHLTSEWKLT